MGSKSSTLEKKQQSPPDDYTGLTDSDGKKYGNGVLKTDKFTYDGHFKNDVFDGTGTLTVHQAIVKYTIVNARWKNGELDGDTFEVNYIDGSTYVGNIIRPLNVQFHGKGRYKQATGHVCDGNWTYGKFTGYGAAAVQGYSTGRIYVGWWLNGEYHGKGLLIDTQDHNNSREGYFFNGNYRPNITEEQLSIIYPDNVFDAENDANNSAKVVEAANCPGEEGAE